MPRVRMQNKYWKMVHVALQGEITRQRYEITRLAREVLTSYNPYKQSAKSFTGYDCYQLLKEVIDRFEVQKGTVGIRDCEIEATRKMMNYINERHNAIIEIEADIKRYEAIDEKVVEAANKSNGLFEEDLGPDYSPPEDSQDDDLLLSVINQID